MLLETVIATGLLIVGLAVIGAQIQGAVTSIRTMERRTRALMLAEQHLAELDLGLVELESVDQIEEGDFGPRYPDWGWQIITEQTGVEDLYLLELKVLYLPRDEDYREDAFEHDEAEEIHTAYAFRAVPQKINFAADFGVPEDEMEELRDKLATLGIPGLDPSEFDLGSMARPSSEELFEILPRILEAMNIPVDTLLASIPPGVAQQLEESGLLDALREEGEENDTGSNGGSFGRGSEER